jgi:hypothetical protein
MRKEVRPGLEDIVCDVCGRTMLKGERAEPYLAPGGQRMLVCELCTDRAYAEGWIRESAHDELPASSRRPEPRRSLIGRLRRGGRERPVGAPAAGPDGDALAAMPPPSTPPWAEGDGQLPPEPVSEPDRQFTRPKDPRHVRAVPTNAQVKAERAVEIFNESEHTRTIAGIARSLGEPWVNVTVGNSPSEVSVVVAWELSWYHYNVDLGVEVEPVTLNGKGHELDELEAWAREWNGTAAADGRLVLGVGSPG